MPGTWKGFANLAKIGHLLPVESYLTLILPTLNERDNIVPQIREVLASLPNLGEIIVVDDDSQDGTRDVIRRELSAEVERGRVNIIHRTQNLGLTNSLRDAIRAARGSLVGWMDCDLSMPATTIPELLKTIGQGYDIAIGSRFIGDGKQKDLGNVANDSRTEIVLSTLLNGVLKAFLRLPITDYTSGFVVAKKSWLDRIAWRGHHGEYFFDFILQAHTQGAKIKEIPYQCGTRKHGDSKTFGTWKAGLRNSYRYSKAVVKVMCAKITGVRTIPAR